jgi:phage tail-like protein
VPFTVFTAYIIANQLRLDPPAGHVAVAFDGYPAKTFSGIPPAVNTPDTYPLQDGQVLTVTVETSEGIDEEDVLIDAADFVDVGSATPTEIADVINASAANALVEALPLVGRVELDTIAVGSDVELSLGGTANEPLLFPEGPTFGEDGTATMVLGYNQPGYIEVLHDGDEVTISQATTFDESRILLAGLFRVPELPSGVTWDVSLLVDGSVAYTEAYDTEGIFSINDVGFSAAQQPGAHDLAIRLQVVGLLDPTPLELPALYLDLVQSLTQTDVQVLNRFPYPDQTAIPNDPVTIRLDLASALNGVAVDVSSTVIQVDGVVAYDGASDSFLNGWDGAGSARVIGTIYNAGATDLRVTLESNGLVFDSEQELEVRIISEHVGGAGAIDVAYNFVLEDTVDLVVLEAQAQDEFVVRVLFDDELDVELALEPSNYIFSLLSIPAASLTPVAVELVDGQTVDVMVDLEMSQGAEYLVTCVNLEDNEGNPLNPEAESASFVGFVPDLPPGRVFLLWNFIADTNKQRDSSGDLRLWILIWQDVVNLLLGLIDKWTQIFDIERAPLAFLDAILRDLGNPFDFIDLTEIDKRRLAYVLVDIYESKGTEPGLINAVRFLTGVEITLDVINEIGAFWELGTDELGIGTELAPGLGDPLWYSFWIDSVVELTPAQRDAIFKIADYMKAAHEHILGIREPGSVVPAPSYWVLGVSLLDEDALLA